MDIGTGMDSFSSDIKRMALLDAPPEGYLEIHVILDQPDQFGLRLEEIVIRRGDGPEILSGLPHDPKVI